MQDFSRGMHLLVDAYDVKGELCDDLVGIVKWLDALPAKVGMRILRKAEAKRDSPPLCQPIDSGVSAFVMLAESHASIHCWPKRHELQFDLYSCKPYDPRFVVIDLTEAFGIGRCKVKVIPRRDNA
jgi:S-adenosylmethionine decarboxylase